MENKNWWEQATAADQNKDTSGTKIPWYNQKSKLGLSIFIWPLWLYGLYKTDLYSQKTKMTWVIGVLILFAIISTIDILTRNT
jgi:hypothetical protein